MKCSNYRCKRTLPSTAKFCAYCGQSTNSTVAPVTGIELQTKPEPVKKKLGVSSTTARPLPPPPVSPRRGFPMWGKWMMGVACMGALIIGGIAIFGEDPNFTPAPVFYPIVVNYDLSLQEMIAAGRYGRIYQPDVINSIAPSGNQGIHEVELILVHFNQRLYSEEVLLLLKERGLRPATFEELLAFGATYPNEQKRFRIAALGSPVWGTFNGFGGRYDPYLGTIGNTRFLAAIWTSFSRWDPETRFAAVVNSSEVGTTPQAASTVRVTIYVPDNYPSIQAAVDAANPGDTIM